MSDRIGPNGSPMDATGFVRAANRAKWQWYFEWATTTGTLWSWGALQLWHAAETLEAPAREAYLEFDRMRENPEVLLEPGTRTMPERWLETGLLSPALMLAGMAIECLFKGCISEQQGQSALTTKKGKQKYRYAHHKLNQLANDAGIGSRLDRDDRQLLELLTAFVEWAGRYPVPLTEDGLFVPAGTQPQGDEASWTLAKGKPGTFGQARELFTRLLEEISPASAP